MTRKRATSTTPEPEAVDDSGADCTCGPNEGCTSCASTVAESKQPAPVEPSSAHALDIAPVNSKIVVTEEGAFLATPFSVGKLPDSDPANKLPRGAKIRKTAPDEYLSDQLSAVEQYPERIYKTTGEAIRNFLDDFHPRGLHSI